MKTTTLINPRPRSRPGFHQRGAALLIAMLIVVLGLVTLLTFRSERKGPEMEAERKTVLALAQAKEALLGYAASSDDHPGSLPCPDNHVLGSTLEGTTNGATSAGCASNIGRLPWRTLRLPDLRDGRGERLWYKISIGSNLPTPAGFQDYVKLTTANATHVVNTATSGTLSLSGSTIANNLAAIVFAPGQPLANQARDAANYNNFSAYLEGYTAASATDFNTVSTPAKPINDRFLTITPKDLMAVATIRMTGELRQLIVRPFPLVSPLTYTWVLQNHWDDVIAYDRKSETLVQVTFSGCNPGYILELTWDAERGETLMRRIGTC